MSNPYRPNEKEVLNDVWDRTNHVLKTSVVSSALPSGAATSSNQATQITAEQAILAKLPTVGTSGVPSNNVLSVQGPPNQLLQITFTGINQSLTLNCAGMGSATFFCRVAGTATYQIQLNFGGGVWVPVEFFVHSAAATPATIGYTATAITANQWATVSTRGASQVRLTSISYTSTQTFDGVVGPYPLNHMSEILGFATGAVLPTVTTVSTVTSVSSLASFAVGALAVNYSDTTTTLAAGETFNGTLRTMMATGATTGSFYADFFSNQASATNGAKIQKSIDAGVTWINAAVGTLTAGVPLSLRVPITAASYRVSYTNGATLQTTPFSITSGNKLFP